MITVDSSYTPIITHGIVAFFGAIVHALEAQRKGETKSFADFLALIFMSSFSGAMFAILGIQFLPDEPYLTAALAGTGGYLGIEGMSFIIAFLKNKFGPK